MNTKKMIIPKHSPPWKMCTWIFWESIDAFDLIPTMGTTMEVSAVWLTWLPLGIRYSIVTNTLLDPPLGATKPANPTFHYSMATTPSNPSQWGIIWQSFYSNKKNSFVNSVQSHHCCLTQIYLKWDGLAIQSVKVACTSNAALSPFTY